MSENFTGLITSTMGVRWYMPLKLRNLSVPNRSDIINQYILANSHSFIIFSDSLKTYGNLQQHGFQYNQVNHRYNFV